MPDIQYFDHDGTWTRPDRAAAIDILVKGGGGGGGMSPGAFGDDGAFEVKRVYAPDIPPTVAIEIGKGGRPGGRDGYVLVITHLEPQAG